MSRGGMQRLLLVLFTAFAVGHASADADAPFLWQVHGPKATHYLLGSVHLLPSEAEDLPVGIEDAYDAAEGVVFETDIAAIEQPQVQVAMLAAARSQQGLKAEIGERMYAQLGRHAARIGMPVSACDPFRAWFCAMTLEVFSFRKAGFSGENGIDKQVYRWAREDGKSLRWFEQPAAHIGLFTGMSEALSRDFLASSLDDRLGGSSDDPAELLRAWKDNDVEAIEKLDRQLKSAYPAVYDHLLAARNRNWMPTLKRLLDGGEPQLVVVGAAHLVGPDGLIAQLRARGYKVLPYISNDTQLVTMKRPALVQATLRR
ncbi:MAG TPA: TraB/GumN family protein [Nevskia sp.]|nr:TraB/GumN family protein [Nevskia sp.]